MTLFGSMGLVYVRTCYDLKIKHMQVRYEYTIVINRPMDPMFTLGSDQYYTYQL